MSALLDSAACLDATRREALQASDEAMRAEDYPTRSLYEQIVAAQRARMQQLMRPSRPVQKPAGPVQHYARGISSYSKCSLCGDTDHRDGACYQGGGL